MEWFETKAKIVYDPYRGGMKRKTEWWAVAEVDKELTRYFRYIIEKKHGIRLLPPSWDAHVSIIRGEMPRNGTDWGFRDREEITLRYANVPRFSGDTSEVHDRSGYFWFVDVDSPDILQIRQHYDRPHNWKFHLTIGRTYEYARMKNA